MIQRAHKIKLKPTKVQETLLKQAAGTARFVYNWGLEKWEKMYRDGEKCTWIYLSSLWTQERPDWAKGVTRTLQTQALNHLGGAYRAFFEKRAQHPTKKKKGRHDSFAVGGDKYAFSGRRIRLPRIGRVKMLEDFRYKNYRQLAATVSREADGWYVSIQCEIPDDRPTPPESVVGVDVGIKCWAIASDGTKIDPTKKLKHLRRILAKRQRLLARKQKGSNNYIKAANKVARTYQTIRRISQDAIHKFTTNLAKNHSVIVVEDLNVKGMKKSKIKGIRRGIQYSEMSEIITLLEYKALRLVKVPMFYPSSKTCSNCGNVLAPHRACTKCGYYKGKSAIKVKEENK